MEVEGRREKGRRERRSRGMEVDGKWVTHTCRSNSIVPVCSTHTVIHSYHILG